jgi:PUA domain protein
LLIKKRHPLSSKDLKSLLEEAKRICPSLAEHIDRKRDIELVEIASGEKIYLQNGKPVLIGLEKSVMPSLAMPQSLLDTIPKVVVDMGAVPFVVNGADVMAPGIRSMADNVKVGDVVLVVDERHSKGLAVGIMIMDRAEILQRKKGKAIKNVHHVGDEIWNWSRSV